MYLLYIQFKIFSIKCIHFFIFFFLFNVQTYPKITLPCLQICEFGVLYINDVQVNARSVKITLETSLVNNIMIFRIDFDKTRTLVLFHSYTQCEHILADYNKHNVQIRCDLFPTNDKPYRYVHFWVFFFFFLLCRV